ncbi:baseplate protein [Rhodococcus phage Finch]|uniref:Baseplate wedge protein n=1 Tax=Rhodococcus phage Finch TaxID=2094144 RepID=A0A2P1JXD9_9CAUD|nr:baseplate protein [Rhodococcus phage Finch]AVO24995.1 baseplate wedge protein [Rhodococcus phage Finch]
MSFSLGIKDGDIELRGSSIAIVHGVDKLKQDVSIWLRERYRSDRFHSDYGSVLDNWIGQVIDRGTEAMVQAEVLRVLQNYQTRQYRMLQETPERLSMDEVLVSIQEIQTKIRYDAVIVNIRFVTGSKKIDQLSVGLGV